MMRCSVPSCKNDSRHISKSQGISFHTFPNTAKHRTAWLKAIGKNDWSPKDRSVVCSDHFLCDDLYLTKTGLRKVRLGALPCLLKVCRICLKLDCKLVSLGRDNLNQAFETLTGILPSEIEQIPQTLCTECAQRLLNCHRFKDKVLMTHDLLVQVIEKEDTLTEDNIKKLQSNTKLIPTLSIKSFEPDHFDYNLEFVEKAISDEQEPHIDEFNEEEKTEVFNCTLDVNVQELKKEQDLDDDEKPLIFYHFNDTENDNDADYAPVSSDDSAPLEIKKKKVKRKTKESKKKPKPTEPKIDRRRKPFLNEDLNETMFTVTDLTVEEQVAEIQKRRETANYKNSVFKCTACFKGFLDEDAYNGHMSRHTTECGEYECEICKTHFKHPHALRKHITAHHTQRFSCNMCPYVTTHRQTARLHERWHKGTKYKCPHCPDEFVKFTTYMGHIRIKHPSDFVCELCGFSFVSEKGIELHKKLKHRVDNYVVPEDGPLCELCNVRFISEEAFKRHLSVSAKHNDSAEPKQSNKPKKAKRKEREGDKTQEDESNEKRYLYPSQMRKAEGPIPCEQCGLQLEDSRAYHGHFRRVHPDKNRTNYPSMKTPCMCEVCGRMFQSAALLRDHRWTHTGERPFACEACGKRFRMRQRLVAHRRVHAPRTAYHCDLCGKGFSTQSNRHRHMFIHTGLRPFKCEMCGKCFKHASEKRAHITYVHLKKPWPKRARGKRRDRGQLPQQASQDASASEMDIVQPVWPSCDPKLNDIIIDKPMYYSNVKI